MSELSNRMLRDMQLAGLVKGTRQQYLRAVRQLTAYYMVSPDRLSQRKVEQYLLYVRDEFRPPDIGRNPSRFSSGSWRSVRRKGRAFFANHGPRAIVLLV